MRSTPVNATTTLCAPSTGVSVTPRFRVEVELPPLQPSSANISPPTNNSPKSRGLIDMKILQSEDYHQESRRTGRRGSPFRDVFSTAHRAGNRFLLPWAARREPEARIRRYSWVKSRLEACFHN